MNHTHHATALVTGASSGIGAAVVAQLAADGVVTVVVARRADRLDALAARWPGLVEPLAADLETREGRDLVVARLRDRERPIDLLVNNAGYGLDGPFAERPAADHLGQVALNVQALVELTTAALDAMVARHRGWLLQVSSLAGFVPAPGAAVYAATKAFVTSLAEALSEELRGSGVAVSALCPGFTRTEFHARSGSDTATDRVPRWAWMSAESVAAAGLHGLATGTVVVVPGTGYRLLASVAAVLPHRLVRRVSGLVARSG
jgi:short-subunit dehydrogenase